MIRIRRGGRRDEERFRAHSLARERRGEERDTGNEQTKRNSRSIVQSYSFRS